ncbi:MAG: hypothetical protein PVF73_04260 [Bacteroidales bacterium]|jgi:hypothetical protein
MDINMKDALAQCKSDLISKYAGSNRYVLKHSDYLTLGEEIFSESKISLSLSTLSRFFRGDYDRLPKISTLNAFAVYLGYANWKEYYKNITLNEKNQIHSNFVRDKFSAKLILISAGILILIAIGFVIYKKAYHADKDLSKVEFYYDAYDSTEIPSTISFHYDIKGFEFDSATFHPLGFLDKRMDDIRLLNPEDSINTYTYFYPGCYYPKLVIDGEIIKERRINFITNTWLASIAQIKPFYIKYIYDEEIFKNGKLAFSPGILENAGFAVSDAEQTWYHLFKDFNNIVGDSMQFETRIKNNLLERSPESGRVMINLFFESENIHLFLNDEKSSFNEVGMWIVEKYHSSKKEDLPFLYMNIADWNKVKCKTHEKQFELYTNDSLVFQTSFSKNIGGLMGVSLIFNGLGEVDYVRFNDNDNNLLYNDEFN